MKTFSQFELKKQNIVEKELFSDRNRSDINDILNKYFGSEKKSRETAKKIVQNKRTFPSGSFDPANQEKTFVSNEKTKNLSKDINKRLSADLTRGDQARSQYGMDGGYGDSNVGDATQNKANKVKKELSQTERMSRGFDKNKNKIPSQNRINTRLTSRGTKSYKPPSKTLSQNIQTKSIINQANKVKDNLRTVDKNINPNVSQGSGSNVSASKGGGTTVKSPQYDLNRKKVQSLKNIKPVTPKRGVIDKLVFGDVDTSKPQTTISKKYVSPLKDTKPQTTVIPKDSGKSGVEKILRDVEKTQPNKIRPGKGFSQFRTDSITRRGIKPTKATSILGQIAKNPAARKATKALGVIGTVADAGLTFADTYKTSQQKGDTKQRSIGKGLAKVAGGAIGGTLGALAAAPIPIPGARVAGAVGGYQYGKKFGGQVFDTLTTMRGRDKLKQSFSNFRKKAMRPAGS